MMAIKARFVRPQPLSSRPSSIQRRNAAGQDWMLRTAIITISADSMSLSAWTAHSGSSVFVLHLLLDATRNFVLVRMHPANRKDPEAQKNNDPKHHCEIHLGPPPARVNQRLTVALVESHNRKLLAAALDFRRRYPFGLGAPGPSQLRQPDAEPTRNNY
jgi:hypothetical protein